MPSTKGTRVASRTTEKAAPGLLAATVAAVTPEKAARWQALLGADALEDVCDVIRCDERAIANATLELPSGDTRDVKLCRRHVPLAGGGALWLEMLKPPAPAETERLTFEPAVQVWDGRLTLTPSRPPVASLRVWGAEGVRR